MNERRFDRNIALFGTNGQQRLRSTCVAVVGVGGLGTHVVQQLALLGIGRMILIDDEELAESNRNRYIGALISDLIPGTRKVNIGSRLVRGIDSRIEVITIHDTLASESAFCALSRATHVFGCLDNDGARLILNEWCSAFTRPYIDLASDVIPSPRLCYGGRVLVNWDGTGCLVCMGELDATEAGRDLESGAARRDRESIYGVEQQLLSESGPAVVTINGIVASAGCTEFMVAVTGLRAPHRLLIYRGEQGRMVSRVHEAPTCCWFCNKTRGAKENADVLRFLGL